MKPHQEKALREQLAPGPVQSPRPKKPGRKVAVGMTPAEIARRSKNDRKYSEWVRALLVSKAHDSKTNVATMYRDRAVDAQHKDRWESWIEYMTQALRPEWIICGGDLMGHREMTTAQNRFLNRYLYLDTEKRLSAPLFVQVVARLDAQQAMYRCGNTEILPCNSCARLQTRIRSLEAQLKERGLREIPFDEVCIRVANEFFHANYVCGQGETQRNVLRTEIEVYLQENLDRNIQLNGLNNNLWHGILATVLRYASPGNNKHHHLMCRRRVEPLKLQHLECVKLSQSSELPHRLRAAHRGLLLQGCDSGVREVRHTADQESSTGLVGKYAPRLIRTVHGTRFGDGTAKLLDSEQLADPSCAGTDSPRTERETANGGAESQCGADEPASKRARTSSCSCANTPEGAEKTSSS